MPVLTTSDLLPYGANAMYRSDDGSSPEIDLTPIFRHGVTIGEVTYDSLFVNTNGNVTFGGALGQFTPDQIGAGTGYLDIIAPFWADVDTRGTTDAARNIFWDYNWNRDSFVVTWNDVGYYDANSDRENTFQLELIDTGYGDMQIVFRYTDINWSSGDASGGYGGVGGVPARAGFSFSQDVSFELPASGNESAMLGLEDNRGNTGVEGAWLFDIRDGALVNVGGDGHDDLWGDSYGNSIFGNHGNDDIYGYRGNDYLYGGHGSDALYGGEGDDFLSGGYGQDQIFGGAGFDIADFSTQTYWQGDYHLYDNSVVELQTVDGIDTLYDVEVISFADGDLRFDTGYFDNFGAAYRFYTSILDRTPDAAGLDFYVGHLDRGVSLFDIAEDISTSPEFVQRYGSHLSTYEFLDNVYWNILDRTPDAAGFDFWWNAIEGHQVSRSEALVYISEDHENRSNSVDLIGGGYFVEDYGY